MALRCDYLCIMGLYTENTVDHSFNDLGKQTFKADLFYLEKVRNFRSS